MEQRFQIISEAQQNGITATCKKYNISRTIYYRWLKRYQTLGYDGLADVKKNFVPVNKTLPAVEKSVLNLIKSYPSYGPRAIKYLLEEIGFDISESAVFNVMKRHNLTNRDSRMRFATRKLGIRKEGIPAINELNSGECWLFWLTDCGHFDTIGNIYMYTLFDLKSKIACSRLYNEITYLDLEDLLTAVAFPVAQALSFETKYLCFFDGSSIIRQSWKVLKKNVDKTIQDNGFDIQLNLLKESDDLGQIMEMKADYTKDCMSLLLPLLKDNTDLAELKMALQRQLRTYNINNPSIFDEEAYSPIQYHNKETRTRLILPLWAYIDRDY